MTKDSVQQKEDEVIIKGQEIVKSFEDALEDVSTNEAVLQKYYEEIKLLAKDHPEVVDVHLGKAYIEGHLDLYEEARNTLLAVKHLDEERVSEMLEGLTFFDNEEEEEVFRRFFDENGEVTEKFKAALKEIFYKFSTDKKTLSDDDINEYHKYVNGEPITEEGLEFLKSSGAFETDERSYLTLKGFIDFYHFQTFNTLSETIEDLKKFGYDENLEKINQVFLRNLNATNFFPPKFNLTFVMLFADKYRPSTLSTLDYHCEIAESLKNLVTKNDFPHLLFYGPSGSGKKTIIMALLREIFGTGVDKMRLENKSLKIANKSQTIDITTVSSQYHVELTPSDCEYSDRHVVQAVIKDIAQNVTLETSSSSKSFKIVIINETDCLSKEAQQALRRTMEKYVSNCKLIFITERISKVIEAVKSRCLCIRVPAPSNEAIIKKLNDVAQKEGFELPEKVANNIVLKSERNLRVALLMLEAAKSKKLPLDPDQNVELPQWQVYINQLTKKIVEQQSPKQLMSIREGIYELLSHCIPPELIIKYLMLYLMDKADTELKFSIVKWAAIYEHRIQIGSKAIYHIEAFIARFMSLYKAFLIKNFVE